MTQTASFGFGQSKLEMCIKGDSMGVGEREWVDIAYNGTEHDVEADNIKMVNVMQYGRLDYITPVGKSQYEGA